MPRRRIYWRVPSKNYQFEGVGWVDMTWEGVPTRLYLDRVADQSALPISLTRNGSKHPEGVLDDSGSREAEGSRDE